VSRQTLVGRRVDVRGIGIWAELAGPPDAVPVVLVNRMAAQGFEWEPTLVGAILDAGYSVLTYDHRGFGWSEAGPVDSPILFQDLVDDARGVLAGFGITRAHLVGSSVGGVISRCPAADAGVRSIAHLHRLEPGRRADHLVAGTRRWPRIHRAVGGGVTTSCELRVMSDDRFDEAAARHAARSMRLVARRLRRAVRGRPTPVARPHCARHTRVADVGPARHRRPRLSLGTASARLCDRDRARDHRGMGRDVRPPPPHPRPPTAAPGPRHRFFCFWWCLICYA
jgi:pimeloyl-ACP methyl ester carboxylesterase